MADQGTAAVQQVKSKRQMAWEKLMLRLLSLEPGMYEITLAIDKQDGFLLGGVARKGDVERWG